MSVYTWQEQERVHQEQVSRLDEFLARCGELQPGTAKYLSRWVIKSGERCSVLYRVDRKVAKTGNLFVELQVGSEEGWALASPAQWVLWLALLPDQFLLAVLQMAVLRRHISRWQEEGGAVCNCGSKVESWDREKTRTYVAHGVAVPLKEIVSLGCSFDLTPRQLTLTNS